MGRMKLMSFRKLLPLLAVFVLGLVRPASAQFGVYATFKGQRLGGVACPSFAAPCANNGGRVQPYGGNFGGFYDFRNVGPVRLGVDVRGDVLSSNKRGDSSAGGVGLVREYAVLAGVRGSVRTPISWLHPYAEVAGGYTRNNSNGVYTTTTNTNTVTGLSTTSVFFNPEVYSNYALLEGFVGLDIRILPNLDLRAVELGAGEAFGSVPTAVSVTSTNGKTSASTVTASSPSTHSITSVGAGVVFRF